MAWQNERSVLEVLQDILGNFQDIIRSEFRLATAEIKEEAGRVSKPAGTLGAAIVLAIYALGFMLLTTVYALATVMPSWLAALLVSVSVGVLAIVLASLGTKRLRQANPRLNKTRESWKENMQWAKTQIK